MNSTPQHGPGDHIEPQYGARLLPRVVDDLARSNPQRVFASVPLASDVSQGFRDIKMADVAQAVDYLAWWLQEHVGNSTSFETLAYMGIPDIRYPVLFLAAVKCGYKVLLTSVRNSSWMNLSLLEQTKCSIMLHSSEMACKIHDLQTGKSDLRALCIPFLDDMIRQGTRHYPYEKDFAKVRWDPILILHSSGSTGPPKPIVMNHATFAVADNDRNLPTVEGRKNQNYALWNFEGDGGRYFTSFPPFHLGGFVSYVVLPIYSTTATVVLGPPDRPSTGRIAYQIMQLLNIRALFCPPSIFEELLNEPEGLELAKRLDFLLYAGGPLSNNTGTRLSQLTDVCQFYGQTETGAAQALVPLREDWASLEWHPMYGADMQLYADDAYEMVLRRDPRLEKVRGLSCNFPEVEEWHTKDLFRPHPSKPNLWQFYGRTDDIIVLSNGEKFNPVPSELIIAGHPLLSGAVITGQGRFQAALLIESRNASIQADSLIDEVWSTVERANSQAPGHARIIKTMVIVAHPDKPFERAGKGTVIRKMTAEKYALEIEALYAIDSLGNEREGSKLTSSDDLDSILRCVSMCVRQVFPVLGMTDDDDLYVLGMDSLQTLEIATMIRGHLETLHISWMSGYVLYANPTIRKLSTTIHKRLQLHHEPSTELDVGDRSRIQAMASLAHKYTQDLPQIASTRYLPPNTSKITVALTGSTGSLGVHLLRTLLGDGSVVKIYCLDRTAEAQQTQQKAFAQWEQRFDLKNGKVRFLQVRYSSSQLGLPGDQFKDLVDKVDVIIHNAWKVDFNHALESFEPVHIRGTRNLVDWSLQSPRRPRLVFISSISSIGNCVVPRDGHTLLPEAPIDDHGSAQKTGYAESKNVAERMLGIASEKSGVPVSILRIGQVAGPVTTAGVWKETEWLPSLLKTSKSLGILPADGAPADWIPVDILASAIVDFVHDGLAAGHNGPQKVYNVLNPTPVPWSSLLGAILQHLGPDSPRVVSLSQWIEEVERVDSSDSTQLAKYPAVKILDYFRDLGRTKWQEEPLLSYSTKNAVEASNAMRELKPVNEEWIEIWLKRLSLG